MNARVQIRNTVASGHEGQVVGAARPRLQVAPPPREDAAPRRRPGALQRWFSPVRLLVAATLGLLYWGASFPTEQYLTPQSGLGYALGIVGGSAMLFQLVYPLRKRYRVLGKTRFALRDRHAEATCAACHFGNRYQGTPTQCASCHAPDDVHRGGRGSDCASCHVTAGWKTSKFDHARETGFALGGAHARLDCKVCHTTPNMKDPLPRDCAGCHRDDDAHATRFGDGCDKCHGNSEWKPATFDHTRDGRFELLGRHAKLDCHACHTAVVAQQKLGTDCHACHRTRDVHAGKLGTDCARCHGVEAWKVDVAFDHDLTEFPLVGLHVAVPCHQCHTSPSYKTEAQDCHACHQRDDKHKGGLGKDCEACHSPNGWGIWEFDHAKATGFALVGAHVRATCEGCHKQPPEAVKLSGDCASCHAQDDVHLGQFGRQCQRCHGSVTFKGARMQ